ncbi:MAG: Mov34/MPN/PAD-1 family protein [Candidatus Kariarchaeaceae archaeon]
MSISNINISLAALAKIISYDLSHPGKETAGLLIGMEQDGIVQVDEMRVGEQKGNAVHVVISDEELTRAAIEVSQRDDGKVIVGWWHTHPNLSAFLSSTDIKTQSLYQAFMPNAVAIVIDDVKYSKTSNLSDLDIGVFRVDGNQAQRLSYSIKDSVEFGLNAFLKSGIPVLQAEKRTIHTPILDAEELSNLKIKVNKLKNQLNPSDISAIHAWIELADSMENGAIQEVPIDIANLKDHLNSSLDTINEDILAIEELLLNKQAQRGLFAIMIGIILELFLFFSFLG